jgi:O-acetyl-ADP-ribose deacetylase (regulator of RNase III)
VYRGRVDVTDPPKAGGAPRRDPTRIADDAAMLRSAYRESMRLAARHKLESIAFPSISTGAYLYPVEQAAPLALGTVAEELVATTVVLVRFVLFDERTFDAYERSLVALRS